MAPLRHKLLMTAAVSVILSAGRNAAAETQTPVPAPPAAPTYMVTLPVIIDGLSAGTLLVSLSPDALKGIEADSWRAFAYSHFDAGKIDQLLKQAEDGLIPIEALEPAGIAVDFDPAALTLQLSLSDDARVSRLLSLRPDQVDYSDLEKYTLPGRSAYVNIFSSQDVRWENGSAVNQIAQQISLEGVVRPFGPRGPALEGALLYDDSKTENEVSRGEVRLVLDDVANAVRYAAGDVNFRSTEFQGAVPLLGVSVERAYDEIQPLRSVAPTGQRSFILQQSSRVDVFINGLFDRSLRLDPGRYDLRDFAFNAGVNDIKLVIEDINGQRREVDFSLFSDPGLLKAGLSEFSFNVGYQRDPNSFDQLSYDFDTPSWSGFYRRGLTDWLTLGASYQGQNGHHVAGAEAALTSPLGIFSVGSAASDSGSAGTGTATSLRWTYDRILPGQRRPHRLDFVGVTRSESYMPLGQATSSERYQTELRARYSGPAPFDSFVSVSARYAEPFSGIDPEEEAYAIDLSRRFGPMNVLVRAEQQNGLVEDTRVAIRVTIPLGRRQLATADWDSQGDVTRASWSRFGYNTAGSFGANAAFRSTPSDYELDAEASYTGNRFEAAFEHTYTEFIDTGRAPGQRSRITAASSIAWADGTVAIGRPINDSFVMVKRHQTLKPSRIFVDESFGRPAAIADRFGPALVPTVDSYIVRRVRWDAETPPLGYDLGQTERDVFPFYRSGVVLRAGSDASLTAIGTAFDADGQPLPLVGGVIRASDGRDFVDIQTFTNRAGRFAAQGLAPGQYEVEFFTQPPLRFNFTIRQDATGLINLGTMLPVTLEASEP